MKSLVHRNKTMLTTGIGVVILLVVYALAGHGQKTPPVQRDYSIPKNENGRYQIVINPNVRADTFLLDTQTGAMWQPISYSDLQGEPTVWQPVDRVSTDLELRVWWSRHTPKTQSPQGSTTPH